MNNTPSPTSLATAPWLKTEASRKLLDALEANGHPVRFVGGCVRDGLLGRLDPEGDLDLTTPARPDQVVELLQAASIKVIPTGLAHGTVTAIAMDQSFEITTLREDVATDGRHAEVRFTDDFVADAARRDFTINAMSVDRQGRLFDYFNGRCDLAAGRIRFVGEATRRVEEDYLRILRFFRFFATYGTPPADAQALAACRDGAAGIQQLSGERIRAEMLKLLASQDPAPALALMIETNVLAQVLPLRSPRLDALHQLLALTTRQDPILRLAALLRSQPEERASDRSQDAKSALSAVADWHLSNAERSRLSILALEPAVRVSATPKKARRDLYRLGSDMYLDLFYLSAAETGYKAENLNNAQAIAASWTSPTLPIRGQDLIEHQVRPGPDLGKLLKQLEDWWLDHDMQPDRDACLAELKKRLSKNRP